MARANQRLYRAWLLKESLAQGLDYRQQWRAQQHLEGWLQLRLITRRAFGSHSAKALMAMSHLCCGGLSLVPPLPVPA